ncbi:MAG: DUF692 domain-containing protein [Alphaproteobacteria bacterium]|nr:DUF692 domain-containing protein [Alphaproteobacteria bacterium]MDE2112760.1 DUF692 domain-containing protein [Alphaproteobacteria bacterium]MDE2495705.1 DUF692 domain-containing protein [Alphaproteobacteria bacterium]
MHSQTPTCGSIPPVPARAGIGGKPAHYAELLAARPPLAFVEVHPENYMGEGGPPHAYLEVIAEIYPLSFHGVGMSLGSSGPLDRGHLARWRKLIDRYEPALISEHIAWSRVGEVCLHDLLPLPYTDATLKLVCRHVEEMQLVLGRRILVENPSSYITPKDSAIPEADFMVEVATRTGCGLLLDINNVFVSATNNGFDPRAWLARISGHLVQEIHLAGHATIRSGELELRIDDHGSPVCDDVWDLYRETIARIGPRPTLIEWDTDVPELPVLLGEAARADAAAALSESPHAAVA